MWVPMAVLQIFRFSSPQNFVSACTQSLSHALRVSENVVAVVVAVEWWRLWCSVLVCGLR